MSVKDVNELKKRLRKHTPGLKPPSHLRISIRYKLAFPILILVSIMILLLFQTTFKTVREVVLERGEKRLQSIAEVFAETVKVPLIFKNQQVLLANIEWMAKRKDVLEVRIEDSEGVIVGGETGSTYASLPGSDLSGNFLGVRRLGEDTYAVATPIRAHERELGRVLILFTQEGFENELRQIFEQRLLLAFVMAICLAIMTAGVTWIAIRPLFVLKKTTQRIVEGDLSARAHLDSFDEIQDLGQAFNEMVSRLAKSLDNLRFRTEALEESEQKYRLIVENASDVIFTFAPDGDIALLNKDVSGCTHEELLAKGLPLLLSLYTEESRVRFEEALENVCDTKEPVTNLAVSHLHHESGVEIFYLVNLTPMLDHEGNVKMIQGVMRDVSELRAIEAMKESLIRDVAHELKTPTAKFTMAMEWFEKDLAKKKQMGQYKEIINILNSNIDRLTRTITSILDLTKLEAGIDKVEKVHIDFNEVLEQVRTDMEPLCKKKGLELKCDLFKGKLEMMGDRDTLYRLFVNLIGNSIKFTEEGSITLKSAKDENHIVASVQDTGMGIEDELISKVFDRFVQKTASSLGIGVGLTISKDIATLHEGKIWVESPGVGKGATFKVEFPAL